MTQTTLIVDRSLNSFIAKHVDAQLQKPKLGKTYTKVLNKIKNILIDRDDPLIVHSIHGYELELPLSHDLPEILRHWPHYSSNLGRLANYANQKYSDLMFIDVGANVGDSIAILRELTEFPILCVDGDKKFLKVLYRNVRQFEGVEVAPFFIGEEESIINAMSSGVKGTSHLSYTNGSNNLEQVSIKTLDSILNDYSKFAESKMLKVDTDGFDCKIIRGSLNFIRRAKPIIFFEYDPFFLDKQGDDGISVFSLLAENGYSGVMVYDNFGDLLLCLPEIQIDRLEELHLYFSGRRSSQYCDICVFHKEDQDVFNAARASELDFLRTLKR
jgi:FkbM family methyltransferase